jgi:hypothetical protein
MHRDFQTRSTTQNLANCAATTKLLHHAGLENFSRRLDQDANAVRAYIKSEIQL